MREMINNAIFNRSQGNFEIDWSENEREEPIEERLTVNMLNKSPWPHPDFD
jgi:hypothetical protein